MKVTSVYCPHCGSGPLAPSMSYFTDTAMYVCRRFAECSLPGDGSEVGLVFEEERGLVEVGVYPISGSFYEVRVWGNPPRKSAAERARYLSRQVQKELNPRNYFDD